MGDSLSYLNNLLPLTQFKTKFAAKIFYPLCVITNSRNTIIYVKIVNLLYYMASSVRVQDEPNPAL